MDGAKHNTDTSDILIIEYCGRQASFLRRSTFERMGGAERNADLGVSKIRFS